MRGLPLPGTASGRAATATSPGPRGVAPATSSPEISADGRIKLPILMYHAIVDAEAAGTVDAWQLCVRPAQFQAQMGFLSANGYTTLTMHEVANVLDGYEPCAPQPIALTFDDGTRDFYQVAYPILRSFGFKATVFVITSCIGDSKHMDAAQIRELSDQGIETGSHSRDHLPLGKLAKAEQEEQIRDSRFTLEEITEEPVISFSYPGGSYDDEALKLLELWGYRTAVTTVRGIWQDPDRPLELRRMRMRGYHTLGDFAARIGAPPPEGSSPQQPELQNGAD